MSNIRFIENYNTLDLFCGCGGLSQGLEKAGLNIKFGIDKWDKAIDTYNKNHKNSKGICADIAEFSPEEFDLKFNNKEIIDIIVGGPPCQGFSMAGKRNTNDPRNSLFMEYVKYIEYFKPKMFIFENVMGILSMKTDSGELSIDVIMSYLEKNYNCTLNKLYASDFGVPQNRRRVIIVGIRKDFNIVPQSIIPILRETERIPVSTILQERKEVSHKYYLSEKAIQGIKKKKEKMIEESKGFGAQFLKLDKPSFTIPARYWKDGYDALLKYDENNIRRLTELELQRIQSFPDTYQFCGNKKDIIMQIGNAVPCKFAEYIGKYAINILEKLI